MYNSRELNHSFLLLKFGSVDKSIPFIQIEFICLDQPYMAEDTRTGIPATVTSGVHHFHGNHVRSTGCIQIRSDVYTIRGISINIIISFLTIDP